MQAAGDSIERWFKIGSIAVAVATFAFGVVQYAAAERDKARADIAMAKRPYLDRQLALYADATRSAAIIASSRDPAAVAKATERFGQLYWGELAMVEDHDVEEAMVKFQSALSQNAEQWQLGQCSLRLAHAVRESLARSWGTEIWKSHYKQQKPECAVQ